MPLCGAALVTMRESADFRHRNNPHHVRRLDWARNRRVLLQSQVRPAPMIVVHETWQVTVQAPFAEHDYVVEALAADGTDDPFHISSLPGGTRCRQHLFDPHGFDWIHDIFPEDPVAIAQQMTGCCIPRKGFPELLRGPLRGGMSGDSKVEDPASVVSQHQKHIQDLESDGRHRKEVDRNQSLYMIVEEGPPSLRWRLPVADHVLADARFADGNAKLEQFAVNPRCAPERVVPTHRTNQGSDVRRDCRSSQLSPSNLPRPEESEALAMPPDHRRRLHNHGTRLPIRPDRRQPGPQEPISDSQLRPLHRPLQNTELMTKGQNLKLKRRTMAKKSQESTRQRNQGRRPSESKEGRQPPNLSATSRFARTTVGVSDADGFPGIHEEGSVTPIVKLGNIDRSVELHSRCV